MYVMYKELNVHSIRIKTNQLLGGRVLWCLSKKYHKQIKQNKTEHRGKQSILNKSIQKNESGSFF